MSRWSDAQLADGILLKRGRPAEEGEPKLTATVQSLLERGW
ncbi:hypothetical protein [Azospirillum argentinense]|nr:hypothetical protein [Azospirillum argentinense]